MNTENKINTLSMITLADAVAMIKAGGYKKTYKLLSSPGIGKTSALSKLATELKWSGGVGMQFVYIYVPDKRDISDIGVWIPDMNQTVPVLKFVANPAYYIDVTRPVFLFLDEIDKATQMVQTLLTPTMTNPKRLGDTYFHPESVTALASNFSTDGVGDKQQDHAVNRQTTVFIRNHTGEEWVYGYAIHNNCHTTVMSWALRKEDLWEMALLNPNTTNPYIHNPKRAKGLNRAFVSARSLMQASETVWEYDQGLLTEHQMLAALRGEIGDAGALDLASYVSIHTEVPTIAAVCINPAKCVIPQHPSAQIMTVMSAVSYLGKLCRKEVTIEDANGPLAVSTALSNWITYLDTIPNVECQRLFNDSAKHESKRLFDMLTSNPAYSKWANKNEHIL